MNAKGERPQPSITLKCSPGQSPRPPDDITRIVFALLIVTLLVAATVSSLVFLPFFLVVGTLYVVWSPGIQGPGQSTARSKRFRARCRKCGIPCFYVGVELEPRAAGPAGILRLPLDDVGFLMLEGDLIRFTGQWVEFQIPHHYIVAATPRELGRTFGSSRLRGFYVKLLAPVAGRLAIAIYTMDGGTIYEQRRRHPELTELMRPFFPEGVS